MRARRRRRRRTKHIADNSIYCQRARALGRADKFDCLPDAHTCSLARRPARLWLCGCMDGWMDRIVALTRVRARARVHPSRVRTG